MSQENDDIAEIGNRSLCYRCVGEPFLRDEIRESGADGACSYCGKKGKTLTIEEMADQIETAFDRHFHRTSPEPSSYEYAILKGGGDWQRDGEPVTIAIGSAAKIDEQPAEDIQKVLEERHADFESAAMGEECPFDNESFYTEKGPDDVQFRIGWAAFERGIKTEARFFSTSAEAVLETIFEGLAKHQTHDDKQVIVHAGPGKSLASLHRARVFQSYEILQEALKRPDISIGPPPSEAANAGRMNARGISVFYGATDPNLALAEVRPPVGSKVMVGCFDLIRPIQLLDVEALRSIYVKGSFFDDGYIHRLEHAKFLESLSHRITQPVMPNDEPVSYLVTQAIADYLATRCNLDGIIYPSVQANNGKANVVLFHHAALVEPLNLPKGAEIDAQIGHSTEDGFEIDYSVWEEVPPPEPPPAITDLPDFAAGVDLSEFDDSEKREPTLRLNTASVKVHHVNSIAIKTDSFPVERHRTEKHESKF